MRGATFACLIALSARAGDAGGLEPGEVEERTLQAVGGFGSDECSCPCDPLRDGRCPATEAERMSPEHCYKPVCEVGYYRCCSTCAMSVCANKFPMVRSRRNLFECLPCMPGDFCPGCDMRIECPDGAVNKEWKMGERQDCIYCDFTEERNDERTECCEAGFEECVSPKRDPNFGFMSSLFLPALLMLS